MFIDDCAFVGVREAHEGLGKVFVALWFVLVDEAVPEFHKADFALSTVRKVL